MSESRRADQFRSRVKGGTMAKGNRPYRDNERTIAARVADDASASESFMSKDMGEAQGGLLRHRRDNSFERAQGDPQGHPYDESLNSMLGGPSSHTEYASLLESKPDRHLESRLQKRSRGIAKAAQFIGKVRDAIPLRSSPAPVANPRGAESDDSADPRLFLYPTADLEWGASFWPEMASGGARKAASEYRHRLEAKYRRQHSQPKAQAAVGSQKVYAGRYAAVPPSPQQVVVTPRRILYVGRPLPTARRALSTPVKAPAPVRQRRASFLEYVGMEAFLGRRGGNETAVDADSIHTTRSPPTQGSSLTASWCDLKRPQRKDRGSDGLTETLGSSVGSSLCFTILHAGKARVGPRHGASGTLDRLGSDGLARESLEGERVYERVLSKSAGLRDIMQCHLGLPDDKSFAPRIRQRGASSENFITTCWPVPTDVATVTQRRQTSTASTSHHQRSVESYQDVRLKQRTVSNQAQDSQQGVRGARPARSGPVSLPCQCCNGSGVAVFPGSPDQLRAAWPFVFPQAAHGAQCKADEHFCGLGPPIAGWSLQPFAAVQGPVYAAFPAAPYCVAIPTAPLIFPTQSFIAVPQVWGGYQRSHAGDACLKQAGR